MKVLGNYNRQLAVVLARAEQQWPTLCQQEKDSLTGPETEARRRTLLLAMTYLDELQRLLRCQANQDEAVFEDGARLLSPDSGPGR